MHPIWRTIFAMVITIAWILMPFPALAQEAIPTPASEKDVGNAASTKEPGDEEMLTINPSAIGEKRETWTSLTDLFGVTILTDNSTLMREYAKESLLNDRDNRKNTLFSTEKSIVIDPTEAVEQASLSHGLFLREKEEVYYQPAATGLLSSNTLLYVVGSIVIMILGVGSFFVALTWNKRKNSKRGGG